MQKNFLLYINIEEKNSSGSVIKDLKFRATFKIPAGTASAKAPLGPTLGQYGIPIAEFCTRYNTLTADYKPGIILKVIVHMYEDQTYDMNLQDPDTSFFIKSCVGKTDTYNTKKNNKHKIKKDHFFTDIITKEMIYEIANTKYNGGLHTKYKKLKSLYKVVTGTARSMGLIVVPSESLNHLVNTNDILER